jgi:zinc protease
MLLAVAAGARASAAPGVPETRTLPNGMRLVVLEDHALPLVAVSLWVHVGSKDEIDSSAGYAHFLEHLVQRGTDVSGPFEYQRLAQRWGGSIVVRSNYDRTYMTATGVPAVLGDMVNAVASMALRATLKDPEIDLELGALNQEIHAYYDDPPSVAFLETMRAVFPDHPYRFPMLGNPRTLGTLKHEPLEAFYRNLYVPNNMVLVLAGDLEPKRAEALAEAAFGRASRNGTLAPKPAPPAPLTRRAEVEKRLDLKEPWTSLGFAGPGYRSADRPAFEVIARVLGETGGAPLRTAVQRAGAGNAARVSYYGLEDAGLLYVGLLPNTPELSLPAARSAIEEILAFKKRGIKEADLRRIVATLLRDESARADSLAERAETLGEAALFGGTRYAWDLPRAYRALTPGTVAKVAARYLVTDNLRLVLVLPKGAGPLSETARGELQTLIDQLGPRPVEESPASGDLYAGDEAWRVTPDAWGEPRDAGGLRPPQRATLDDGLTVIVQEDHRRASLGVSLFIRLGSSDDPAGKEGLASIAGRLLAATGAAEARGRPGAAGDAPSPLPEVEVARDLTELRLLLAPEDLRRGLSTLGAAVRPPRVEAGALETARKATLASARRGVDDPDATAVDLFHEQVYFGDPYAHPVPGTIAGIAAVTPDDVEGVVRRRVVPGEAVLALAGDVSASEALKAARDLFRDWRPAPAASSVERGPSATARAKSGEFTRSLAATPSRIVVGVPGTPIDSQEFEGLRLLGTELTLRSFEETVFTRRAALSFTALPEAFRRGGALGIAIVAAPSTREEALFDLQRLMRRIALEGVPADEIPILGRVQAGRGAAALQGAAAFASALGYRQAIGLDALSYRDALTSPPRFTSEQLKALAERFLKPDAWIVVKVGPAG